MQVEALVRFVGIDDVRCVVPDLHEVEAVIGRMDISRTSELTNAHPGDFCKVGDTLTARCDPAARRGRRGRARTLHCTNSTNWRAG